MFDVLEYVSFAVKPLSRAQRAENAKPAVFKGLNKNQAEFVEFALTKYIETGIGELDQDKLPDLLNLKYQSISDADKALGGLSRIREIFVSFQKHLYSKSAA